MSIAIFLATDLNMGGGVERWALNTIFGKPEDVKITVISTDYSDSKRFAIDDSSISKIAEEQKLSLLENKFNFFRKSRILSFLLDNFLIPLLLTLFKGKYSKELNLSDVDTVYLTKNQYWKLFSGKKIVGSNHTEFGSDSFFSIMKARLYKSGLIYRNISSFHVFPGRKKIEAILGEKAKIAVIPNGTPCRKCDGRTGEKISFLFVGRLESIKGIEILLEAWKNFNRENCHLNIIGKGSFNTKDYAHLKNVSFKGIVTDEKLNEFYCNSDVFIYPTLWDSFPNTIIEAMSAGCKIITSNFLRNAFGGTETQNFITFIKPEADSVSKEMASTADNIERTRKEGELAFQFFANNYEISIVNNLLFSFLNSL